MANHQPDARARDEEQSTAPANRYAESFRQTLSLAYAPEAWLGVLASIQDELRILKRDALLGHLLEAVGA